MVAPVQAIRSAKEPVPQPMSKTTSVDFMRDRVTSILRSKAAGLATGWRA
jgi:hypothetical protein